MKRAGIVVLAVLVGLAAGAIWTLLQSDRYRADARVLVRPASSRVVPPVEALAESSLVETNVAQTLHLSRPPHISATRGDGGVLTVSVEGNSRERARQVDAEAVVILTQKVAQRFGNGASATVLDPAHVAAQTSPTPGRNLLITGLAALVLGVAAAAALSTRRASAPAPAPVDPAVEERLQSRIGQVTQRERSLAQRAGQLAVREQDLERRRQETEQRAAEVEAAAAAAAAEPEPELEPEPEPEPEPELEAEPRPDRAPTPRASWTLGALEEVTRLRSDGASAEQQEEWSDYLFLLREHADADGSLPSSFEPLIINVFGPLQHPDE